MATRMLQRRGTAAEWAAQNPILGDGEMGYETDTKVFKIGDGVTPWVTLTSGFVNVSLFDTKGDILAASADNTPIKVPVGSDGSVLIADSTKAAGLAYSNVLRPATAALPGLVIKSQTAQTGNIAEFQDGTGTVLSAIRNTGVLWVTSPSNPSMVIAQSSTFANGFIFFGQVTTAGTWYTDSQANDGVLSLTVSSGKRLRLGKSSAPGRTTPLSLSDEGTQATSIFKAQSGQTSNITEWRNNTDAVMSNVDNNGGLFAPYTVLTANVDTGTPLLVRQHSATHSADLTAWQNNSGSSTMAKMDYGGRMYATYGVFGSMGLLGSGAQVELTAASANKGLVLKSSGSDTAFEVRNAANAIVGGFDAGGRLFANSGHAGAPVVWDVDAGVASTGSSSTGASFGSRLYTGMTGAHFQALDTAGVTRFMVDNNGNIQMFATNPNVKVGNATFGYSSANGSFFPGAAAGDAAILLTGGVRVGDGTNYKPIYASAFNVTSTRSVKTGIEKLENPFDVIKRLRPVRYAYKGDVGKARAGFIAEEVAGIYPEAVSWGHNDEPEAINYGEFAPLFAAALQSHEDRISALEQKLAA